MTATFQNWGMSHDWALFTATIIGILVIALPLMLAVAMIRMPTMVAVNHAQS